MTADAEPHDSAWVFVGWWALFSALVLVGRLSAVDQSSVGLVSPAAGAALLWLLAQRTAAAAAVCVTTMLATRVVLLLATGAAGPVTVAVAVAGLVQTVLLVVLLRRWCPSILGAGGSTSVHEPAVLARGSLAVLLATGVGAVVGSVLVVVLGAEVEGRVLVDWWARNLTGVLFVGAVGHLAWEWVRNAHASRRWSLVDRSRVPELIALLAASGVVFVAVFVSAELPLAFVALALSVWSATRFATIVAVLHAVGMGALVLAATLSGLGPFGALGSPDVQALVTHGFLLTMLLTVLTLATGRDERAALARELRDTQRETLARAEMLDAMTEAMSEGLVVLDAEGTIVRTNAAAKELLTASATGYQRSFAGYRTRRPDGSEIPAEERASTRVLRDGYVAPHDVLLEGADGAERVLAVTARALAGGERDGSGRALIVYRDVTEERLDSNRLTEFAEVVAHDLRSPLTVMHGWLDVALSGLVPPPEAPVEPAGGNHPLGSPPLVRRALERALVSTIRMEVLISDLLLQATAAGGALEPTRCVLDGDDGLLAEIAEEVGGSEALTSGGVPPVFADIDLVRQLFANLVGNGLKYVAPGIVPMMRVVGSRCGDRIHIELTDNGIGVPESARESIFDRFHRAHADDSTYVGTGLGLAICRTIVERHGGTIVCRPADPRPDQPGGMTFAFDLPAA